MPKNKLYLSYVLLNFHKKIIHIKCDYLKKQRNLFKKEKCALLLLYTSVMGRK
jgi:hypothetical protein